MSHRECQWYSLVFPGDLGISAIWRSIRESPEKIQRIANVTIIRERCTKYTL